jgi:hypothetical protein
MDSTNTSSSNLIQFYSTLNDYTKHVLSTRTSIRKSQHLSRSGSYFMTDGQSVRISCCRSNSSTSDFLSESYRLKVAILFLWGALSDERTGLQFAVQSLNGPSRAEPITIIYCLIWDPQPIGLGSHIYIPQERGGPVILPGTGLPLRHFLRLAGLRWMYSNPSPTWRARSLKNRMVQSKVKAKSVSHITTDGQSISMSWCLVHTALESQSERISNEHQEGYIKARNCLLPFGRAACAVQIGIWVPTQHLLWDEGKPRKSLIELAGRRIFRKQADF